MKQSLFIACLLISALAYSQNLKFDILGYDESKADEVDEVLNNARKREDRVEENRRRMIIEKTEAAERGLDKALYEAIERSRPKNQAFITKKSGGLSFEDCESSRATQKSIASHGYTKKQKGQINEHRRLDRQAQWARDRRERIAEQQRRNIEQAARRREEERIRRENRMAAVRAGVYAATTPMIEALSARDYLNANENSEMMFYMYDSRSQMRVKGHQMIGEIKEGYRLKENKGTDLLSLLNELQNNKGEFRLDPHAIPWGTWKTKEEIARDDSIIAASHKRELNISFGVGEANLWDAMRDGMSTERFYLLFGLMVHSNNKSIPILMGYNKTTERYIFKNEDETCIYQINKDGSVFSTVSLTEKENADILMNLKNTSLNSDVTVGLVEYSAKLDKNGVKYSNGFTVDGLNISENRDEITINDKFFSEDLSDNGKKTSMKVAVNVELFDNTMSWKEDVFIVPDIFDRIAIGRGSTARAGLKVGFSGSAEFSSQSGVSAKFKGFGEMLSLQLRGNVSYLQNKNGKHFINFYNASVTGGVGQTVSKEWRAKGKEKNIGIVVQAPALPLFSKFNVSAMESLNIDYYVDKLPTNKQ